MSDSRPQDDRILWYLRHQDLIRGPFTSATLRRLMLDDQNMHRAEVSQDKTHWRKVMEVPEVLPPVLRDGAKPATSLQPRPIRSNKLFLTGLGLLVLLVGLGVWLMPKGQKNTGSTANCNATPGPYVNWSNCRLGAIKASNADLQGLKAANADLHRSQLGGSNLKNANLAYANLDKADLAYTNLEGANLKGASLRDADLSYANLQGADLSFANLVGAKLGNARMEAALLDQALLDQSPAEPAKPQPPLNEPPEAATSAKQIRPASP